MDGKTVRLSDLKGHPVLIDYWATWCAPCREGLPETAHLALIGAKRGLRVLAISDEGREKIQSFLAKQTYHLAAYQDDGDAAQHALAVDGLPSEIFIDSNGNIVSYLIGQHPAADILAALAKAGAKLDE